jgi:hypothetical protein
MTDIMLPKSSLQIVPHLEDCATGECGVDLNPGCPDDLKIWDSFNVVACNSSCLAYNTDDYCCRGVYFPSDICKSSPSAVHFKRNCPKAYSYKYDDETSTFTCRDIDYTMVIG